MDELLPTLLVALLLLARTIPLVEFTTFVGDPWVPRSVRLAVAGGLAAWLAPHVVSPAMLAHPPDVVTFAVMLCRELAVGLALGFLASLVFEAARMAGAIVDRSVRLDGAAGEGPMSRLYVLLAATVFLLAGGHRVWLRALSHSYQVFMLSDVHSPLASGFEIARIAADAIAVAVLFALPVIATLLLVDGMFALMNRGTQVIRDLSPASIRVAFAVGVTALGLAIFADEFAADALATMDSVPQLLEGRDVR